MCSASDNDLECEGQSREDHPTQPESEGEVEVLQSERLNRLLVLLLIHVNLSHQQTSLQHNETNGVEVPGITYLLGSDQMITKIFLEGPFLVHHVGTIEAHTVVQHFSASVPPTPL